MNLLKFLFKKNFVSNNENININIGEKFEQELLNKYGKCNHLLNYGLKILFITDTHNCLAYTDKYLNYLESIDPSNYDLCIILGDLSGLDVDAVKRILGEH